MTSTLVGQVKAGQSYPTEEDLLVGDGKEIKCIVELVAMSETQLARCPLAACIELAALFPSNRHLARHGPPTEQLARDDISSRSCIDSGDKVCDSTHLLPRVEVSVEPPTQLVPKIDRLRELQIDDENESVRYLCVVNESATPVSSGFRKCSWGA